MTVLSCLRKGLLSGRQQLYQHAIKTRHIGNRGHTVKKPSETQKFGLGSRPQLNAPMGESRRSGLVKCFAFATGFSAITFGAAAIWRYENIKTNSQGLKDWLGKKKDEYGFTHKEGEFRAELNKIWNHLPPGEKVFWGICSANLLVLLGWRIPSLQIVMRNYFCSSPALKAVCWPMLLSTFSHASVIHFGMNMYVLHSFSRGICDQMGKEQFLAFYLSGGVMAALFSNTIKIAKGWVGPSIGASGAIMAALGFFCSTHPDATLQIIFIPNFTFTAENAIQFMMCLDAVGILLGWKLFDHAAHLGGAACGVLYAKYGHEYIWKPQVEVIKKWKSLTGR